MRIAYSGMITAEDKVVPISASIVLGFFICSFCLNKDAVFEFSEFQVTCKAAKCKLLRRHSRKQRCLGKIKPTI